MAIELLIQRLASNAEIFRTLVAGVSPEQARWRPAPDKWSILEAVNHLYDEERLDFHARLEFILGGAAGIWPPTDPPGWVVQGNYNERDFAESLDNFLREREQTIVWLRGLSSPDWDASYYQPSWGSIPPLTARDMLASWVAHDLFHIRQIAKMHYQYLSDAEGYNVAYAGEMT